MHKQTLSSNHFRILFDLHSRQLSFLNKECPSRNRKYQQYCQSHMRRGHKRTQSATLTYTHSDNLQDPPPQELPRTKLEIPALLTKSSAKIKEKVCQVESLHVSLTDFIDPLFTFGKGSMARKKQVPLNCAKKADLMAIPERAEQVEVKPKGADRKTGLYEFEQCKEVQGGKMTAKVYRMPFEEKANKVIKENLSPKIKKELEMKKKPQFSILQTDPKTIVKPRGHVKHASNVK